jgi:hypothetical protein
VVTPLVCPVGAPVVTPVCVLTAPARTTDCGKDNMQLEVSAATSDWALGTNCPETLPHTRGEGENTFVEQLGSPAEAAVALCQLPALLV